jgi:2-(1,2-epoxy-1,2-dihydrophenyl)acetyl-CoA isomerase
MDFEHVTFSVDAGVARIRFNRPDALNAFTRPMGREVLEAVRRCDVDDDVDEVRVVVFTGEGRAFSAGADVKDERPRTPEGNLDLGAGLVQIYNPLILAVRQLPKPVIAAVNGVAAGIACSLACACDLIIASRSAYFLLAFARIGLVPDGGASVLLPARVGLGRAARLAMLGDRLPASEALAWGLVDQLCADEDLQPQVDALATRLAAGPSGAYAGIKSLLNRSVLGDLEAQLGAEAALQYERGLSAEYAEGTRAFAEKRAPDFPSTR